VPRAPAHPSRLRVPHRAALLKPPPSPRRAPNPSRPRGVAPDHPHRSAGGEGSEGRKEEERSRPWESHSPRRPKPPVGGAGPAGNDYIPYFLYFPDDAMPSSSSPSPASRTASLHRRTALRPGATEVRTTAASLLWIPRPSSRSGTHRAAAPPLVMPAFVPGCDAASCRCRCLRQRAPLP
jgi:hypothetical protein